MESTTSFQTDVTSSFASTFTGVTEWSQEAVLWTLIFGFIGAFVLAFAVGANDVANSFGTTVGANVLTLKAACILASIFETVGAVLLGAKVGETIRKGIIDVTIYNVTADGRELLMMGEVSAISGSAIWQLIATMFGLPVSGTHSIVGACIGFSLVAVGFTGVNWEKLGLIGASWLVSPVLAGSMSVTLYFFVNRYILKKEAPLENGLRCLPFFYGFTIAINSFSILYSGAPLLGFDHLPIWTVFLISFVIFIITAVVVLFVLIPRLRRKSIKDMEMSIPSQYETPKQKNSGSPKMNDSGFQTPSDTKQHLKLVETTLLGNSDEDLFVYRQPECQVIQKNDVSHRDDTSNKCDEVVNKTLVIPESDQTASYDGEDSDSAFETCVKRSSSSEKIRSSVCKEQVSSSGLDDDEDEEEDPPCVRRLFSFLQILTACFASFAHGGNDVSNAIGPLIALWLIYHSGTVVQRAATPWYLLVYGGVGIVFGLWILGRRVIQTIGKDLTKVTPSRGFCIELMTALTVLLASNVGIPVSTTHCKVGSVVSIGWFRSRSAVKWSMVRNIALAWFITVPVSGLFSAGIMYFLMFVTK